MPGGLPLSHGNRWGSARRPIIALSFNAEGLGPTQGGSLTLMELLAITGGLQILSHLNLSGMVLSDCQGLIRKITQRNALRRNTTNAGYPLLRDCVRLIVPHCTLHWIKGHPERSRVPRSGWTQDQLGNYLADLFAGSLHSPVSLDFPQLTIHPTITHEAIAQDFIQPEDGYFIAKRAGVDHDLALIVNRLNSGPGRSLGRAIHHLLFHHRDIAHRGQLWTGLWAPRHRELLGPHLHLCSLKQGQRILLYISTWATASVTTLWTYFKEHGQDQELLPPLLITLPDAHAEPPAPLATAVDLTPADSSVRPARESPSPPTKWRRLARPPTEPPPQTLRPCLPMSPLITRPHLRHRSPADLEPPARHGFTWRAGITDGTLSSAPVPRRTTFRIPGIAELHNGGVTASADRCTTYCLVF